MYKHVSRFMQHLAAVDARRPDKKPYEPRVKELSEKQYRRLKKKGRNAKQRHRKPRGWHTDPLRY
jgi:hypothetical protein